MAPECSLRWRAHRSAWIAACALALLSAAARPEPPRPPRAVTAEAKRLLGDLVAIDTTQAGSTAPAAQAVADSLRKAGFLDEDLWIGGARPDRQNLVARFRGQGAGPGAPKPILFLSHLDVVAAPRAEWTVEPFQLTEKDGFLWGRGTLDIKGEVADLAANFARLKREGFVPARDLVLVLTADEEEGDANGVAWLQAHRPELFDVAYVINTDAGGLQMRAGRLLRMPIQTSEKLYVTYELEATSAGGHSALPTGDNAIARLAAALARLEGLAFPVELNETTRRYFAGLAADEASELRGAFRGVLADPPDPEAVAKLSAIPWYNATLRSVCSPTLVSGGEAENALPQRATAAIQCRLLPADDPATVRDVLVARIADPAVSVRMKGEPAAVAASPIEPRLFAAVEAVTRSCWPGVPVLPVMDPWASDGALLRAAGVPVYGISGIYFDVDDVRSHGADERIATAAFEQGLEFMYRLMRRLGATDH
jgi:acetylornithine deacetylase/succinyl-diaminopimelate desuccinylase-like protein